MHFLSDEITFKVTEITSSVAKITVVVAEITFQVAVSTSSVGKIIFIVAEITFKVIVTTSSEVKITFCSRLDICKRGYDHFFSGPDHFVVA